MANKDSWDKLEVTSKVIAATILVIIPMVIKSGADSIAQSIQRGQLVQSLTQQLVEGKAKRDIALIALDAAIPAQATGCDQPGCQSPADRQRLAKDQVLRIAEVLVRRSTQEARLGASFNPSDVEVAGEIISARADGLYYKKLFLNDSNALATSNQRPSSSEGLNSTPQERAAKARTAALLIALQPPPSVATPVQVDAERQPDLRGIRIVYIQVQRNLEAANVQAKRLQALLTKAGVSAPGIEMVNSVGKISIRYANAADLPAAERLRRVVASQLSIKPEQIKLINLADARYVVPAGQIEVWLR